MLPTKQMTHAAYGNVYFEGGAHLLLSVDTGLVSANFEYTADAKIPTAFANFDDYCRFVENRFAENY